MINLAGGGEGDCVKGVIWEFREGFPEVVTFEPGLKESVGILALWPLPGRSGA